MTDKEPINFRNDDFMVIGKCKNAIAVYKNHESVGEVIFYDSKLNKTRISTLPFLTRSTSNLFFSNTISSLSVFFSDKDNKKKSLYMSTLGEDFQWTEPKLLIDNAFVSYRNDNEYNYCISEDRSKTLIYIANKENNQTKLQALIVDAFGQIQQRIDQSFQESDFQITDIAAISNEGNMFLVATDQHDITKNIAEKLILISSEKLGSSLRTDAIELNHYYINDLQIVLDNINKNVSLCGYFSDAKYKSPRGIYLSSYNFEKRTLNANLFTPLALQISSSQTDLKDMKIRNVFLKKTGEIELVTEKTYQNTRSIGNISPLLTSSYMMSNLQENTRTVHEFSNDEIVVFNIKVDGSMAWTQTILKDQTTVDDNGVFSSFGVLQHRLGNVYIFGDVSNKQSRLLAAYISGNGELSVKELQTNEDMQSWNFMPRSAVQLSKSEIMMPCVSKSYLCFLKISY